MLFHTRAVPPPLRDLVDIVWLAESGDAGSGKERLLPTGTMELIVNLREDVVRVYDRESLRCETLPGAVVAGVHAEYFVIDTEGQASVAGVHFKPGGAFALLGVPAIELRDRHVALEDLWGMRDARELRERLLAGATSQERLAILESVLLERLRRAPERHPAVAYALRRIDAHPHRGSVAGLVEQIGLSQRRFIDVFSSQVGLTPKLYCRVQRFQRVLRRIQARQDIDWTDLALACGYFDQPHFIRDFRAFSGLNPTAYLALRTPHLNHVPMAG